MESLLTQLASKNIISLLGMHHVKIYSIMMIEKVVLLVTIVLGACSHTSSNQRYQHVILNPLLQATLDGVSNNLRMYNSVKTF